jgi:hypothetical protein
VPLERIIVAAAKRTGKKFVLDPRVHGNVVILGQDPSELTYPQFPAVLEVYGFVAADDAGIVQIVPDATTARGDTSNYFKGYALSIGVRDAGDSAEVRFSGAIGGCSAADASSASALGGPSGTAAPRTVREAEHWRRTSGPETSVSKIAARVGVSLSCLEAAHAEYRRMCVASASDARALRKAAQRVHDLAQRRAMLARELTLSRNCS